MWLSLRPRQGTRALAYAGLPCRDCITAGAGLYDAVVGDGPGFGKLGRCSANKRLATSGAVKVFGCRPMTDSAAHSEGRRPKTSTGGNRELGRCGGAASALRALWGFDRDGSIDGKRATRSMATVDEVGGHERSAFEGHGWIAGRRLAGKKWHRWHVRASVMVAGREPAKKTSGFAASWPRRGGHEVSILIAAMGAVGR